MKGPEREALIQQIKSQLMNLKRLNCGKQIAAIEKLIYENDQLSSIGSGHSSQLPSIAPSTNASSVDEHMNRASVTVAKAPPSHVNQVALPFSGAPTA